MLHQIAVLRTTTFEVDQMLNALFDYCEEHEEYHVYFLMDEVYRLSITYESALGTALFEGRKADLNVICAIQDITGKGRQERLKILAQAAVKVFFRLDSASLNAAAAMIDSRKCDALKMELQNLPRSSAIVWGDLEGANGEIITNRFVKVHMKNIFVHYFEIRYEIAN